MAGVLTGQLPGVAPSLNRTIASGCSSAYSHLPLRYLVSSAGLTAKKRCRYRRILPLRTTFCCSQTQTEELQIRKCSPFLESQLLSDDIVPKQGEWKVVPDIWRTSAEKFADRVALVDPYHDPPAKLTYKELEQAILDFCEGLRAVGVKADEKIALFADNSCRWLIADQGIMATGAINVVRGSRSSVEELLQIYNHSQSMAFVVDTPEMFNRVAQQFSNHATTKFVILLWGEKSHLDKEVLEKFSVVTYMEIIELGRESREVLLKSGNARKQYTYEAIKSDGVATLVYTSGTTGNPKGVMLTHQNLLHQINNMWEVVPVEAGDKFLSMLPPWHAYERAAEYFIFTHGAEQMYTMVKYLKEDLKKYQPDYLISVPLVYETLYSGIQKQLSAASALRKLIAFTLIKISLTFMEFKRVYEGKYVRKRKEPEPYLISVVDWMWARTIAAILWPIHVLAKKIIYNKIQSAIGISKAGISGGGSLPLHVDKLFEAIGILVQNGYGLTETSPVVACRQSSCNVLGSVGHTLQGAEVKVVDVETKGTLPPGSRGIVKVKGALVMKGYYRNPQATEKVLDEDGWLDTGDLGWIAPHHSRGRSRLCGGVLVLEGRAKDTIVLKTGENVEPSEIEAAAIRSTLIQQIVVVGQDQRRLGAIIVPNREEALVAAKKSSLVKDDVTELSKETLTNMLSEELRIWTSSCSFQVGPVLIVDEAFTIDNGLMTPTMKVRRDRVADRYRDQIAEMYK